jgi:hypothetical protein
MHILDIKVEENLNTNLFTIKDTSVYDENFVPETPVLEVKVPGGINPVIFSTLEIGFNKQINVNELHLNGNNIFPLPALPDGNYVLRYSVAPNLRSFISYNYFRNIKQQNYFHNTVVKLHSLKSNYNNKSYYEKVRDLLWIRELMLGCKYISEELHDVNRANEEYKEINHLLNNFNKNV